MTEKILIIFALSLTLAFSLLISSYGASDLVINTVDLNKWQCGSLAFDQNNNNFEFRDRVKEILDECVEKGLITREEIELAQSPHRGISSREFERVYSIANGDIEKTMKIINDPNYPKNIFGTPYEQVSIGIEPENVLCREGLELIFKSKDNSPACVKPDSKLKLIERGWAIMPTDGFTPTEAPPRMNDITRDSDYTKTRDSGNMQINNKSELVLSEKELDTKLESLRMAGLPVVSSGVDYDLGVIVIYTPDPTQIDLFQAQLGNTPFVLLYEESPPRWEHDGPEEQKEMPPTTTYYDPTGYYEIFTETGPLGLFGVNEKGDVTSGSPLLSEINCMRYASWLTEFQKKKIDVSEDYPRYPPWGNEIFPLVDYCLANGDLIKTIQDDKIHWEFQLENEN
jgi:hypothetical protein